MTLNESRLRRIIHQLVSEVVEPFELDLVNKLKQLNNELDKVAFQEAYDGAFEEITAVHTAIDRLVNRLKQPASTKQGSGTFPKARKAA